MSYPDFHCTSHLIFTRGCSECYMAGLTGYKPHPPNIGSSSRFSIILPPGVSIRMPDPLEAEKRALFDGKRWTFQREKKYYLRNKFGPEYFTVANPVFDPNSGMITGQHLNSGVGYNRVQFYGYGFEVQLSDGSWYYPWTESTPEADTNREPTCVHKWVDVGILRPKIVCKWCDIQDDTQKAGN